MQENLTSHETLHDENSPVRADISVTLGDTLTIQAILCVLMVLGFIILNMVNGGLAAGIFEIYESRFGDDSTVAEVFAAVVDFLGTAPIDNV